MTHTVRKDWKAIGWKWVFKVKCDRDAQVERHNKYGVDSDEYVFTNGTLLSITVQNNLHVHQMNGVNRRRKSTEGYIKPG